MSKDNSIARRGSGTSARNMHAGRRITVDTHEDQIKREKDLVSYSPYGYKDTVNIENELGKRRYMLRRMKQNVRQEYRHSSVIYGGIDQKERIELKEHLFRICIIHNK